MLRRRSRPQAELRKSANEFRLFSFFRCNKRRVNSSPVEFACVFSTKGALMRFLVKPSQRNILADSSVA